MGGHLEKRSNKTWTIVVEAGVDPGTGKRKRIKKAVKGTKRDAEREMRRIIDELERGVYVKEHNKTTGEYLEEWLKAYAEPLLASSTYDSYQRQIRKHIIPFLGRIKLSSLTALNIQKYYAYALERLSPKTVYYHHTILHLALKCAVRWGYIYRNPVEVVKPPKKVIRHKTPMLTPEEIKILLEQVQKTKWFPMIYTALKTGMRRGELLGLRWENIDFNNQKIRLECQVVRRKGEGVIVENRLKTETSKRTVDLPPSIMRLLEDMYERRKPQKTDLVFSQDNGKPIDPIGLTKAFRRIANRAGFPSLTFHDLRHLHASILLNNGVPPIIVQERLGHSVIETLMNIYGHAMPSIQEGVAQMVDKLIDFEPKNGEDALKQGNGNTIKNQTEGGNHYGR